MEKIQKGHLFYNLNKNYENDNFDDVELNIKIRTSFR